MYKSTEAADLPGPEGRGGNMKYLRRIGIILPILALFIGTLVIGASAQRRGRVSIGNGTNRPVVVRRYYVVRRPFWRHHGFWGHPWYDPWYDPYWRSPYLRHMDEKYRREQAVRNARRELRIHQEKYARDGIITAKEREELYENERDLRKAIERLNRFNRDG